MKRRMRGNWRSIRSWRAPELVFSPRRAPRSLRSSPSGPRWAPSMRKPPMRVRRITSPADIAHTMASHSLWRACNAGSTASM